MAKNGRALSRQQMTGVNDRIGTRPGRGVNNQELAQEFRRQGVNARIVRPGSIGALNRIAREGSAVLLWKTNRGSYHYSVYEGHDRDYVYVMDPERGHTKYPREEFLNRIYPEVLVTE